MNCNVLTTDVLINQLQQEIAELKARWPAHSAPPAMLQRLDELDEELERLLNHSSDSAEALATQRPPEKGVSES